MRAASDSPCVLSFALHYLHKGNESHWRRDPASLETSSPSLVCREGPSAYSLGARQNMIAMFGHGRVEG